MLTWLYILLLLNYIIRCLSKCKVWPRIEMYIIFKERNLLATLSNELCFSVSLVIIILNCRYVPPAMKILGINK